MSITVTAADEYIKANVVDIEGWEESDVAKQQRMLNVAERTMTSLYSKYTIPDAAVYEFAAALATAFSDTMVQAQRGVQSLSISGAMSLSFRNTPRELKQLIPQVCRDLIGDANGINLRPGKVGRLTI